MILTTHSMEEAEALCTRVGIMVKGELRALGTPQHLKHKFGSGYEISVKPCDQIMENPSKLQEITEFVHELFPDSRDSRAGGLMVFTVPPKSINVGRAFDALESNKSRLSIQDYAIAQPTLEQVFVRTVQRYSGDERLGGDQSLWVRASLDNEDDVENQRSSRQLSKMSLVGAALEAMPWIKSETPVWLGLDFRGHRFLAMSLPLFMIGSFITIELGFAYAVFPFLFAIVCLIPAALACLCVVPHPEDDPHT